MLQIWIEIQPSTCWGTFPWGTSISPASISLIFHYPLIITISDLLPQPKTERGKRKKELEIRKTKVRGRGHEEVRERKKTRGKSEEGIETRRGRKLEVEKDRGGREIESEEEAKR